LFAINQLLLDSLCGGRFFDLNRIAAANQPHLTATGSVISQHHRHESNPQLCRLLAAEYSLPVPATPLGQNRAADRLALAR
jgi:hypothetical protein